MAYGFDVTFLAVVILVALAALAALIFWRGGRNGGSNSN